jgi:hypothetical protein
MAIWGIDSCPLQATNRRIIVINVLKIAVQIVWTVFMVGLFTFIGAIEGYASTGALGAVVVGFIGCFFGAALAASPLLALQLFQ